MTINELVKAENITRVWRLFEQHPETFYRGDLGDDPDLEFATKVCTFGAMQIVYPSIIRTLKISKLHDAIGMPVGPWNDTDDIENIITLLKELDI
jgi:hypothetical protein